MNNNYKNDYHSPLKQAKLHFMLEKAPLENDEFFTFANQLAKLFPNERPDFSQFPEWVFLNTNIDQNSSNPLYILLEWAKNKKYCEYLIHYIQPLIDSIQPQDLSYFTHFPCLQLKIVYFFIQNMSFFPYPEHPKLLKMYWESFYAFSKPFLSEATYLLNSPYSMDKIISVHILTYLLVWLNAISLLPSQDEILDVLGYITQLLLEKRPIFASQVGIQCLLYLIQNEFPQKYLPQFIPAVIQAASEPILPKVYQCIRLLLPYIQPEDFKTELKHFLFTQKFNDLNFICQNEYLELMSSIIQNLLFDYYPPIY
ncbi:hypothetical protein TRFO_28086 [Tritrichomonas foetus]|uniref:Uncharacterized protein n=1 Tax=Tritrichomonas foetus TaxID=1144522 RepID=A0A1J4JZ04_9EUKA|nr:hypothetical protein TRFO_28086 [Tritrichomonas foetus]|eukprot:OHT04385.1 hypothetical protein TRFO_28086 [Tritrichomonas foetus]